MTDTDLRGKRVLIREDLNVPVQDGVVTSDARIRASLPTIRYALDQNAQGVHPVAPRAARRRACTTSSSRSRRSRRSLSELLGKPVPLRKDWLDGVDCPPGSAVLCENVRFNKGEKKDERRARAQDGGAVRRVS